MEKELEMNTPVKARIEELLRRAHEEEQALLAGLSEAERAATGTAEVLSAKDILAHLAAAKQRQTQQLVALGRGETPSADEHDEAQIFAHYQNHAWQEIQAEAERSFAGYLAQVQALSEADLIDPRRHLWLQGRTLAAHILAYGMWHPTSHLVEIYQRWGAPDRARRLYEALTAILGQPEMAPLMHSDTHNLYNLACAYAVTGRGAKALELLPEALRRDPALLATARHDPDLAPLRADPAFQALLVA